MGEILAALLKALMLIFDWCKCIVRLVKTIKAMKELNPKHELNTEQEKFKNM